MLTNIRRVGVAVTFLFALTAFGSVPAGAQDRAADFSFRAVDGPAVTSESLRGEVVVLAFGASWLPLTRNQMEAVKKLADQYAGHAVGLINPAIYQIEAKHEHGIVDVTKGSNTQTFMQRGRRHTVRGFSARIGYDLVTGAGTINAAYFVPELARLRG